jgi:hypothetical protein
VLLAPADDGRGAGAAEKEREVEAALATVPRVEAHWFRPADHDIHAQHPDELADLLHREATVGLLA